MSEVVVAVEQEIREETEAEARAEADIGYWLHFCLWVFGEWG
jgi:hypothetical protein